MKHRVQPVNRLSGDIFPPSDKSVSHRAAILNSLAQGEAVIENYSGGADCQSTLKCLRAMGVVAENITTTRSEFGTHSLRIISPGLERFSEPREILNAGNSGTTMRFLLGVLAAAPFVSVLTGDRSLRTRPMGRIVHPLMEMGCDIMGRQGGSLAPIAVRGGSLHGIDYEMPVPSAQVKSSLIIAGLFGDGSTILKQRSHSRDHTERMLDAMGASLVEDDLVVEVRPGATLKPVNVTVSGDISSAAFWLVASAVHPDSRVQLRNVGINPTRSEIIDILKAMGAKIRIENRHIEGGEPVADLFIESSELTGVEISGDQIPIVQDEVPILALAACFAKGTTIIRDAAELRVKESDRLLTTAKELSRLGAHIRETDDGLVIEGTGYLNGGSCRSYGDHRLAMTLGVAGLVAKNDVVISGSEAVNVSYPDFWNDMDTLTTN